MIINQNYKLNFTETDILTLENKFQYFYILALNKDKRTIELILKKEDFDKLDKNYKFFAFKLYNTNFKDKDVIEKFNNISLKFKGEKINILEEFIDKRQIYHYCFLMCNVLNAMLD